MEGPVRALRPLGVALACPLPAFLLCGCTPTLNLSKLVGRQPAVVHRVDFFACPAGFRSDDGLATDTEQQFSPSSIDHCSLQCDRESSCTAFRYSPSQGTCALLDDVPNSGAPPGFQVCRKRSLGHFQEADAPLLGPSEFVEQTQAHMKVGSTLWLYAVGSSSLVWMTWVDQIHLALRRLGYTVPSVPARWKPEFHPRVVPQCDDTKYFQHLKTSRFGRIGWSSWDFALNGWEGCGKDGFRMVGNLRVKCQHGAGCAFSKNPTNVSDIAYDASLSNITLIATWYNDDQHWSTHFKCFNGQRTNWHQMAPISIHCLQRMVQKIHEMNPHTWIVIMAKYPETYKHRTEQFILDYNAQVKEAMEREARTLFVDFYMPSEDEGDFYQSAQHGGHPNCRGSQIMAHAALDRLYKAKVLARSLRLLPVSKARLLADNCSALGAAACHTSAVCWMDPARGACRPYQAGTFRGRSR
mmetsp:Transcript_9117/g.26935  ORF Transcript_9117/g.26935 Transcript_9117/m.26935 type:complete len:468 (+) Transcript_9117:64-1467(+)